MFGRFAFKKELKVYFNNSCQHPYDPKRSFCKRCDNSESDEFKTFLSERRTFYNLESFDQRHNFFEVKNHKQMFKLNLINYHHQFHYYFKKMGVSPNIEQILHNHDYVYKDFYPELHIPKNQIII